MEPDDGSTFSATEHGNQTEDTKMMIALDSLERWTLDLDQQARTMLRDDEYAEYQAIPAEERLRQLQALLERPIARFTPVNEVFFRTRWAEALRLGALMTAPAVLEVASGDADMLPQMMARVFPHSRYITANMNRPLTESLRRNTEGLAVTVEVIEEDAARIAEFLPAQSVDWIVFQHAVNDVLQGILCGQEGVDTVDADWMAILPCMIQIMQREMAQHTLEAHVKAPFLALLRELLRVLKPGGLIAMNHYMFQLDLDWGYPADLWENLIPRIRPWMAELAECEEVDFDGFDPQWWLFLRKKA
jgi:SAM-dependent methyltransferase